MATQPERERCSYDDETKKICVDTLACDQGELYALKKRISRLWHTLITHAFLGKSCSSQCLLKE